MTSDRGPSGVPVRTIFLGSGAFAVPILEAMVASPEVQLVGVVSAPDRPSGRRAELTAVPVVRRASQLGLRLLQPERLRRPEAVADVVALRPDLGVLADYGQIVPATVLAIPRYGILNVHPSALPRHRGATPIPATIADGDQIAGVTLIRMDEGLDTGPIVAQETWDLDGSETTEEVEQEAASRAAALIRRTLRPWLDGVLAPTPQDEADATLTRPLRREDGRLDLRRPAAELERLVRAHVPWPGSFVEVGDVRLIVLEAEAIASGPGDVSGRVVADGDGLALTTADGRLRLIRAQLAGRRPADAVALRRGAPTLVGQTIELR